MRIDPTVQGASYLRRREDVRVGIRADEVEFRALKEDTSPLTEALRDEEMLGATAEECEVSVANKWYRETEIADERTVQVYEELVRRQAQLGDAWPFELSDRTLKKRRETPSLVYELCLTIARAGDIVSSPYNRLPVDFERVALVLLKSWLGGNAEGVRTGWPREEGFATRAKEFFEMVRQRTSRWEWRWEPEDYLPKDPGPRDFKEAKLDLLAWLKMPDNVAHLYFAGQCACGADAEMDNKARELTQDGLRKWVKEPCMVPLVRCFFVPHILPAGRLLEIIGLGGATFDRTRLALIAHALPEKIAKELKKELQDAVKLVVSG
jgi:hypothetical protein